MNRYRVCPCLTSPLNPCWLNINYHMVQMRMGSLLSLVPLREFFLATVASGFLIKDRFKFLTYLFSYKAALQQCPLLKGLN